ncbi:hypothetical protein QLX08_011541 [Tetragonisca angustula]|uniref:CCHC-type domain-containing protein n=1 Tax=Tetragonisca angustula TaxID=166442 RepID=A0AAW0Z7N2_9HYME
MDGSKREAFYAEKGHQTDTSDASGSKPKKRKEKKSDEDSASRDVRKRRLVMQDLENFPPLVDKMRSHKELLGRAEKSFSRALIKKKGGKRSEQDTDTQSMVDSETEYEPASATKDVKIAQEGNSKARFRKPSRKMVSPAVNNPSYLEADLAGFSLKEQHDKLFREAMHTLIELKYSTENDSVLQVIANINEMQSLLVRSLMNNCNLEGQVVALKQEIAEIKKTARSIKDPNERQITEKKTTYAERVGIKSKVASLSTQKKNPPNIVKILPESKEIYSSSEVTKGKLQELITPKEEKLNIKNLRRIQGNGVLVETESRENIESLLASEKLRKAGLTVEIPPKKNPRLIIYDVPKMDNDTEIIETIIDQNINEKEKVKLRPQMRIAFKTGDKSKDRNNVIIEVSKEVRDILINKGRLFMGWSYCRVQDYIAVTRCYKCQGFGHTSRYCKSEMDICGHCSTSGHSFKDCPNKHKAATCSNCKRMGRNSNHVVTSRECPLYISSLNQLILRTDYGV